MIEKTMLDYLNENLEEPVFMEFPIGNTPERFYVLEKTGGNRSNQIAYATFALQSYGGSRYGSAAMNLVGINTMLDAVQLDSVSSVSLNSDYNFTDTTRKRERYQAVFDITHYEME